MHTTALAAAADIDPSDRRALEERLLQAEKMESIGRLAGGIAHDFNNLLTAILGYTEMLLAERSATDPDRADLEQIQHAGRRAATLTQQLLAFSRKQMLMPRDVDLNQTVGSVRAMLTRLIREDIALVCDLAPAPAVVTIDPSQIEQVILNLVLNARDALPAGGNIRLEVARVTAADVTAAVRAPVGVEGDSVRLRVRDNAIGMTPETRPHLFEPFFTTKQQGKGTGLGLASVYGIVRQSNGFIDVESTPAAGTTFTMHFPAVVSATQHDERPVAVAVSTRGHETILLVEDEDAVRAIAGTVLRRQGYEVIEAATPLAAAEIFEKRSRDIDLLLTDIVMPEMNGPALAQRLIGIRPSLRVLFMSGYADVAMPIDSGNPQVSFLAKPFQASMLTARVREMLTADRTTL